jgi:hypothetical protein
VEDCLVVTDTDLQLSETLSELRAIRATLNTFDNTVAAVTLRPELSRLQRQLDLVSEVVRLVVQHLPDGTHSKQDRGEAPHG